MSCDKALLKKISEVVDRYIRPSLDADGGDLEIVSLEGNALCVRLHGACSGCPRAGETLRYGVEATLRRLVSKDIFVIPVE
ncbi:MAG: NifU family protein [Holosporaceae bacterium]|jgi:NifU-like protein|nr:NifU family protein [Holosporaceae bacterium]